jgi:hypothetical protein
MSVSFNYISVLIKLVTNVIVGAFGNVMDANNSGIEMLLDLACQLLYIPLFLEWVATTTESGD